MNSCKKVVQKASKLLISALFLEEPDEKPLANGTTFGGRKVDDVKKEFYTLLATTPDPAQVGYEITLHSKTSLSLTIDKSADVENSMKCNINP